MTSTYKKIATITLGSAQASTTFSTISSAYTDLVLISNVSNTTIQGLLFVRVNSDSATNYSRVTLIGNGSTVNTAVAANEDKAIAGHMAPPGSKGISICNFQNYSNTTTYKNILGRGSTAETRAQITVGTWRNTVAITSIELIPQTNNIEAGSTFTLYGILKAV